MKYDGATQGFAEGVKDLAALIRATYGPRGRNVLVDRGRRGLLATTDGMTVAGEWQPVSPLPRLATEILRQAAHKVGTEVGDGTSTTMLLASALYLEGVKLVTAGVPPVDLVREIQGAVRPLLSDLSWLPHQDATRDALLAVAQQSTKFDAEVSAAIVDAAQKAGKYGLVSVEEGRGRGVEVLQKSGLEVDTGWESSDFAEGNAWDREACLVAVIAGELRDFEDITPILEAASTVGPGDLPVLVVSYGVYGDALKTMVLNSKEKVIQSCALRCPGGIRPRQRERLEDLAALTMGQVYDPEVESEFESHFLGSLQHITVEAKKATLVAFEDAYDTIGDRIEVLRALQEGLESNFDREQMQARIAGLSEGLVVLRVGGDSDLELKERRARIEDALSAVRAAHEEGLVPGAGMSYLCLARVLGGSQGEKLLRKALSAPLKALCENAGAEYPVVAAALPEEPWVGYDVVQASYRDLRETPALLEPLAVFRAAVEAAVSVAGTLLTCDTAIVKHGRYRAVVG